MSLPHYKFSVFELVFNPVYIIADVNNNNAGVGR
ncbi:protein of unknown function [Moritella yayanosii]|uniref:Uncharacterized protein n=1 Tax=Moritella yayanosii TaxID=69539 RepID=A0A330LJ05_9GAMM|nr:protein of unknown function [Moritella yayanosii]